MRVFHHNKSIDVMCVGNNIVMGTRVRYVYLQFAPKIPKFGLRSQVNP